MKPRTARRGRRPRLRVVSPSLTTPRRILGFKAGNLYRVSVEFWSEAEWEMLSEWERPEGAAFMPGAGWIQVRQISEQEVNDIRDQYLELLEALGLR